MSRQKAVRIEPANTQDVTQIETIVKAAYSKYVERIGRPPAPMLADYAALLTTQDVYILRMDDEGSDVLGSIVLAVTDDDHTEEPSLKINNLVVAPSAQGRGYGRVLMNHAEDVAQSKGLTALTLFTNVKMHENIGLYKKLGFTETGRRTEGHYERVYFRKDVSQ